MQCLCIYVHIYTYLCASIYRRMSMLYRVDKEHRNSWPFPWAQGDTHPAAVDSFPAWPEMHRAHVVGPPTARV